MIPARWLVPAAMYTINLSCVGGLVGGFWWPLLFWLMVPAFLLSFIGVDRSDEETPRKNP